MDKEKTLWKIIILDPVYGMKYFAAITLITEVLALYFISCSFLGVLLIIDRVWTFLLGAFFMMIALMGHLIVSFYWLGYLFEKKISEALK